MAHERRGLHHLALPLWLGLSPAHDAHTASFLCTPSRLSDCRCTRRISCSSKDQRVPPNASLLTRAMRPASASGLWCVIYLRTLAKCPAPLHSAPHSRALCCCTAWTLPLAFLLRHIAEVVAPQPADIFHAALPCWPLSAVITQDDDSACPVKVTRGREANGSELSGLLEVAQEYTERRDGPQSAMQTVSQIITCV